MSDERVQIPLELPIIFNINKLMSDYVDIYLEAMDPEWESNTFSAQEKKYIEAWLERFTGRQDDGLPNVDSRMVQVQYEDLAAAHKHSLGKGANDASVEPPSDEQLQQIVHTWIKIGGRVNDYEQEMINSDLKMARNSWEWSHGGGSEKHEQELKDSPPQSQGSSKADRAAQHAEDREVEEERPRRNQYSKMGYNKKVQNEYWA